MPRKPLSRRKLTKSRRSPNTKKSNASTRTSRSASSSATVSRSKSLSHKKTAYALYRASLRPKAALGLQEALVEGVSMWPLLRPGYTIRYRQVDPEVLLPGDLIVLMHHNHQKQPQAQVHRLVGRVGPFYLEAGDNTFSASLVRPDSILGRVEEVRDWKGKRCRIPGWKLEGSRFRYFVWCANAFMYAHELKDRLVGNRKSKLLWRMSQTYRAGLHAIGLEVPAIFPKHHA